MLICVGKEVSRAQGRYDAIKIFGEQFRMPSGVSPINQVEKVDRCGR